MPSIGVGNSWKLGNSGFFDIPDLTTGTSAFCLEHESGTTKSFIQFFQVPRTLSRNPYFLFYKGMDKTIQKGGSQGDGHRDTFEIIQ